MSCLQRVESEPRREWETIRCKTNSFKSGDELDAVKVLIDVPDGSPR